jgi:hypothetical protein
VNRFDARAIASEIDQAGIEIAIVRLPAHALAEVHALRSFGLAPIVADTHVSYDFDLCSRPLEADARVTLREAGADDGMRLESLASEVFAGYATHFHANPVLSPAEILAGYSEWAASHVRGDDSTKAWLIQERDEIIGFSCVRLERSAAAVTGTLNGIVPRARGHGAYRAMLRNTLLTARVMGFRRFDIATQVQNLHVQRVWISEGFMLRSAWYTIHINALRSVSARLPALEDPRPPASDPGDIR